MLHRNKGSLCDHMDLLSKAAQGHVPGGRLKMQEEFRGPAEWQKLLRARDEGHGLEEGWDTGFKVEQGMT